MSQRVLNRVTVVFAGLILASATAIESAPRAAERQILALTYPEGSTVSVKFQGTSRLPQASGEAKVERKHGMTEIEIQGHLDDRSGAGASLLSMERAKAVSEYLRSKGVEPRRMKPAGYGASRPLGPNRTASGREANRRIEIRRLN